MKYLLIAIILLNLTATGFSANWPARVFAPYMYIGAHDNFKIAHCADVSGQKFYTIAFIIANKRLDPAWFGRIPMDRNLYADQINTIRERGGDVIVSFGGADGTEPAIAETNAAALEAKYQSVIDQYKFSWLDFDIEGDALTNQTANVRRNLVLTRLQAKNPGLIISYTLPVDPGGISVESRELLADAKARGVKVHSVNVMTMDFGAHFSKGRRMSDVSIVSTIKAHEQCQSIDSAIQIGVTPMIGQNDEPGEIFTQADARAVIKWAQAQPWVCSLSFWASNRDAGKSGKKGADNHTSGIEQKPWEFTSIFEPFTTAN
ncbi:MAG TPA: chitinase [Candidatus Acidoferrum sp.]|jgi:hypothetical protein|nr:chitinase [Candidatus Acidoferrum sp.]